MKQGWEFESSNLDREKKNWDREFELRLGEEAEFENLKLWERKRGDKDIG